MSTPSETAVTSAERRLQAIAQSRVDVGAEIASAKARLTEAERRAVESGDLKSKELRDARQALLDHESTARVIGELLEDAKSELTEARAKVWNSDRDRLRDNWVKMLRDNAVKIGAAIQAIERLRAVEAEANATLGANELPAIGGGNTLLKLRLFAETIETALSKHDATQ